MRPTDTNHTNFQRTAFSLVELSIVLVILGLLTGGILAGQSLIRAAELRAVSTEFNRYYAALHSFRDKYFALPGDMTNATSFWGDQATGTSACASAATADGTPGTCNGDGNGSIGAGAYSIGEALRAWQHLAMAGLIEGSYTGYIAATNVTIGTEVPRSKLGNAGWALFSRNGSASNMVWQRNGNFFLIATSGSGSSTGIWSDVIKTEEAWNIDTKMDDGRPEYGKVMGGSNGGNCTNPTGQEGTATLSNREYALTTSGTVCRMWFDVNN